MFLSPCLHISLSPPASFSSLVFLLLSIYRSSLNSLLSPFFSVPGSLLPLFPPFLLSPNSITPSLAYSFPFLLLPLSGSSTLSPSSSPTPLLLPLHNVVCQGSHMVAWSPHSRRPGAPLPHLLLRNIAGKDNVPPIPRHSPSSMQHP